MALNNLPNNMIQPEHIKGKVRLPGLGIAVLFGSFFLMILIIGLVQLLTIGESTDSTKTLRLLSVLQDILAFILPAILAAIVVTRLPATFLCIDKKIPLKPLILSIIVMFTAMPAMEWIVSLNAGIHFPDSMQGLEETLRTMENEAETAITALLGAPDTINIIISILIIGLLTGLSEELFFRGALQNLFFATRMKKHLCIWITAIIFSALHFQFFGFVPRILLGAYFGYMLWWTGSLWVPILLHALNNSLVVLTTQIGEESVENVNIESVVESTMFSDPLIITLSFVVTIFGLYLIHMTCKRAKLIR